MGFAIEHVWICRFHFDVCFENPGGDRYTWYCSSFYSRLLFSQLVRVKVTRLFVVYKFSSFWGLESCIAPKWRTKMLHYPIQSLWAPAHSFWLGLFWEMAQVPNMYFFGTVPSICQVGCCTPRSIPSNMGPLNAFQRCVFWIIALMWVTLGDRNYPNKLSFFLQMFLYAQA